MSAFVDWWLGGEMGPAGSLVWTSPDWAIFLAVAAALLAWGASLVGERTLLARIAEVLFWGAALAGMVVALAGPVWVEEEGRTEPGRVAVLVDGSRSMGIIEDGKPRSDQADRIISKLKAGDVDVYQFGDDIAVGAPTDYSLPGTDLEGALDALSERVAGEKLAGVVVVTDGLDRGLLRKRMMREPDEARPPELPGPLTVYQVGSASDVDDLAVRGIDVGGYAFVRSPFRIKAQIQGVGFSNRTVKATLKQDGVPRSQESVRLDDDGNGEVVFEVVPETDGRFTYEVSVPVYEGDAVPSNNAMPVVVRVVRDKIRVLQVAGAPSWDVKFLRRFLKGDPSVDLVSFFILRTNRDIRGEYRDQELSLIQFPYERLFAEDLWTFDVVIFQNFDYQPYFNWKSTALLDNLRRYVEEQGRAFVMIGGDRSFGLGRYGGTPLAKVLPLQVGVQGETVDEDSFRPALTDAGRRHPITRLVGDVEENDVWWERLSALDGTNVVVGPHEDASVLLSHPTRTTLSGEPLPVLAVREAGAGRTMALTVDSSWRWSLSEAAEGRGNQAYLRFWKNAMRWMMADPTVSRVTVDTPRENYAVGDDVRIVIRVRDPDFAPFPGADVDAKVAVGGRTYNLEGRTGADGEIVLVYPAGTRGAHRVSVTAVAGEETVGSAETVFAVTTRDPELDEVAPDARFLKWLAGRTGGRFYGPGDFGPAVRDPKAGRKVFDRRETPLWRAPLLALWICAFAGMGWIVRRRSGLR